jgi:hypothetical protein
VVPGNHSLTSDLDAVTSAVKAWLGQLVDSPTRSSMMSP